MVADLVGKGRRVRTVAVPVWVRNGINAWQTAAGIDEGPLLRSIRKGGKIGEQLSDWAPSPDMTPAQRQLRQLVVASVTARTSKQACGAALDHLFGFAAGRPLS